MVGTSSTNTRIAVIGVGGWGKNHARVLREFDCLAAICDLDLARAKEIASRHGAQAYSSIDEMLEKERLDGSLSVYAYKHARGCSQEGYGTWHQHIC